MTPAVSEEMLDAAMKVFNEDTYRYPTWRDHVRAMIAAALSTLAPSAAPSGDGWLPIVSRPTDNSEGWMKLADGTVFWGRFHRGRCERKDRIATMTTPAPEPLGGVVREGVEDPLALFSPLPVNVYPVAWRPGIASRARLSEDIVADAFERGSITDGKLAERLIHDRKDAADALEAALSERDALTEQLHALETRFDLELDAYAKDSDLAAARERVTALEKALEPFAKREIGPIEFRDGRVTVPQEWIDNARAALGEEKR
jgi:hypothetical protein